MHDGKHDPAFHIPRVPKWGDAPGIRCHGARHLREAAICFSASLIFFCRIKHCFIPPASGKHQKQTLDWFPDYFDSPNLTGFSYLSFVRLDYLFICLFYPPVSTSTQIFNILPSEEPLLFSLCWATCGSDRSPSQGGGAPSVTSNR